MIRFICNFIFFGVLFYAIWLLAPEAFNGLVNVAGKIYNILVDLVTTVIDYISDLTKPSVEPSQAGEGATFLEVR